MAGLFYLPRLFVYHTKAPAGSPMSETFKVMEEKLMRVIMNPAAAASWIFGITMVSLNGVLLTQPWFIVKILFVLILTASHLAMNDWRKAFAAGRNVRSERFFRIANEIPTLGLMVIVIMVIVRPF
jgi:putative membrane protein